MPHEGAFSAETVTRPAYELNVPHVVSPGKAERPPFLTIDAPNVIAEALKPAEDGSDAFVLRLYECEGTKTQTKVRFGTPVGSAVLTNLLEDEGEALALNGGAVSLTFRPFEIKTVKCRRG